MFLKFMLSVHNSAIPRKHDEMHQYTFISWSYQIKLSYVPFNGFMYSIRWTIKPPIGIVCPACFHWLNKQRWQNWNISDWNWKWLPLRILHFKWTINFQKWKIQFVTNKFHWNSNQIPFKKRKSTCGTHLGEFICDACDFDECNAILIAYINP